MMQASITMVRLKRLQIGQKQEVKDTWIGMRVFALRARHGLRNAIHIFAEQAQAFLLMA
jgi:hypothetical protein